MKKIIIFLFFVSNFLLFSQDIKIALQPGKSQNFENLYFSNDNNIIAGVSDYKVTFFDKYGAVISSYDNVENNSVNSAISFSPDDKLAIIPCTVNNVIFEIKTGNYKIVNKYAETYHRHSYALGFIDNKTYAASFVSNISMPVMLKKTELQNNILSKIEKSDDRNTIINLYSQSPDDPEIMLLRSDKKYSFDYEDIVDDTGYDTSDAKYFTIDKFDINGKFIETIYAQKLNTGDSPSGMIFNSKKNLMALSTRMNNITVIDLVNGKLADITVDDGLASITSNLKFINNDKNIVAISSDRNTFHLFNLSGIEISKNKLPGGLFLNFDNDLLVSYEQRVKADKKDSGIFLVKTNIKKEKISEKKINFQPIYNSIYSEKNQLLYNFINRSLSVHSLETGKSATIVMDTTDWMIYLENGYWECSRDGSKFITMIKGLDTYGVEQLAVRYNRPDLVYSALGSSDLDMINHYKALYLSRLKKLNLTEKDLLNQSSPPEVTIESHQIIEAKAEIKFSIKQTANKIISYNIFDNNVPVYGSKGKKLDIISKNNVFNITETINLNSGDNKIEISAIDITGVESDRAMIKIRFNAGRAKGYKTPDLYYIGFGVSKYRDENLNLNYADKDVSDLKDIFGKMKNYYNNVYTYTFLNREVTKENIINAKKLLSNASENDTFVFFISGHGVHDNTPEAKYYYLLYDTDINNLSGTAADFDLIEDILQGISPRNKLFLMDTCESGEYVEDYSLSLDSNLQNPVKISGQKRMISRGIKKLSSTNENTAKKRLFLSDTNRYIYNNLARRSGTIVFSSCKANELSYESDEYKNGFFTKELIYELTKSNGEQIPISDLKKNVIDGVRKISFGLQNPTVDRDNIYINFSFPLGKK